MPLKTLGPIGPRAVGERVNRIWIQTLLNSHHDVNVEIFTVETYFDQRAVISSFQASKKDAKAPALQKALQNIIFVSFFGGSHFCFHRSIH